MKIKENRKSVIPETKKTTEPPNGDSELFDVQDLLEAFFEFIDKVPPANWNNREELMKIVPHFHRYTRFESLCRVFGIPSVDDFMSGDFIYERIPNELNCSSLTARYIQLLFSIAELSELIKGIKTNRLVKDLYLLDFLNSSLTTYSKELSGIIDPDSIRISRSELIGKYGFPTESIFEIDMKYSIF